MSPDAPTLPPPGGASGLNIFIGVLLIRSLTLLAEPLYATPQQFVTLLEPFPKAGIYPLPTPVRET
jgi:hypothetical protein